MANGFEKEFMNRISRICKQWGFGEPAGRIWGLLLLKNKPLTQKEIVEESGYSLSLVSPNLNILQKFGMVSIIGKQGKKRLYLSPTSFIESFAPLSISQSVVILWPLKAAQCKRVLPIKINML